MAHEFRQLFCAVQVARIMAAHIGHQDVTIQMDCRQGMFLFMRGTPTIGKWVRGGSAKAPQAIWNQAAENWLQWLARSRQKTSSLKTIYDLHGWSVIPQVG